IDGQRTAPFSVRLGLKRGTFACGIVISLPVRGLRPLRAARLFTQNVPKPLIVTRRPLRSESKTALTNAFIARSAECLEEPAALAICATSSALVMGPRFYARDSDSVNLLNGDRAHRVEKRRRRERLFQHAHVRVLQ